MAAENVSQHEDALPNPRSSSELQEGCCAVPAEAPSRRSQGEVEECEEDDLELLRPKTDFRRRLLLLVDETAASRQAFDFTASKIMDLEEDLLIIMHCRPRMCKEAPVPVEGIYSCLKAANAEERKRAEASKALLEHYQCLSGKAGVLYFKLLPVMGDIREKLLEWAQKETADMVIVGSKHKGTKGILGAFRSRDSIPDFCLHNSPCPVLIVQQNSQLHHH